jgi:hypothetical protein
MGDSGADFPGWVTALKHIAEWNPAVVVPGHGGVSAAEILQKQAAYIDYLWTQVNAGIRSGKTADELIAEIDLSKHGSFGAGAEWNAAAIRAMYTKAVGK